MVEFNQKKLENGQIQSKIDWKSIEIAIDDKILSSVFESDWYQHLNLNGLESEWSMVQFRSPNHLSLISWWNFNLLKITLARHIAGQIKKNKWKVTNLIFDWILNLKKHDNLYLHNKLCLLFNVWFTKLKHSTAEPLFANFSQPKNNNLTKSEVSF